MKNEKSINPPSSDAEISTQQAADLLNVSQPYVIKLLEAEKIPFKKVKGHRRIRLRDVVEYNSKQQKIREESLTFLAEQAQALNLGYE